jgi:CDP-4-dehydro-6-deoxyglucose reductase, E1
VKTWSYPLASSSWGAEEVEAATAVLRSGRCTMGEKVYEFETAFARYFGVKHAIFVNSGSSANLVAMHTLRLYSSGGNPMWAEAIAPALGWSTTYSPIHHAGYAIRLVDIDLDTLNIDLEAAKANLSHHFVSAVVVVNFLGNPAPLAELNEARKGLWLIEDNCESIGAAVAFGGSPVPHRLAGTVGDIGTFSTFFSHHICTMEGGVAITNRDDLADIARSLRAHGWSREMMTGGRSAGLDSWQGRFNFVYPGFNLRPTEVAAAIGIEQLKKLPAILDKRRENAAVFKQLLADLNRDDLVMSSQKENGYATYYSFPLILRSRLHNRREELIQKLEEAGIETRPVMAGNIARHRVAKYMRGVQQPECYPRANYVHDHGLMIGNSHLPLTDGLMRAFEVIRGMLG